MTDPKNAQYVVEGGARRQVQEWDPAENGGHEVYDTEKNVGEGAGEKEDPFAKLEKQKVEENKAKERQARVEELEKEARKKWSDPYALNEKLRRSFRRGKRRRTEQMEKDIELKNRIGWNDDKLLVGEVTPGRSGKDGELWKEQQASNSSRNGKKKEMKGKESAAQRLQARLIANSRKKRDPFLNHIAASQKSTGKFSEALSSSKGT